MEMKKLLAGILAAFLVLAAAGTASALTLGGLQAVVYADGDNEIVFEIDDNILTMDLTATNVVIGTFDLSEFIEVGSMTELNFGVFAAYPGYNNFWGSTEADAVPGISTAGLLAFNAAATQVASSSDLDRVVQSANDQKSYNYNFNQNGTSPGLYAGINSSWSTGEATLTESGETALYLYGYTLVTPVEGGVDGAALAKISVITDGSTTASLVLNYSVPVPSAIIMLGVGLIGLAGIRRRQ